MTYQPQLPNKVSSVNSTASLLLAGATFTGSWEDVTDYNTASVAILGSLATSGTLYFDVSTDGGSTFGSIPAAVSDATFAVPRILNLVETYIRVRYINGAVSQTGSFSLQTRYATTQQMPILSAVDGVIKSETPTQVVRAVSSGRLPNGGYGNIVLDGSAFSTITPLASLAVYDSGVLDMSGYTQVQTEISADQDGTLEFIFYEDSAGTNTVRSISVPYVAASGYQLYAAPTFGYYVKYKFTNTSASLQTDFFFSTKFLTKALSAQVIAKNGFIAPSMTANLVRTANDFNTDRNTGLVGAQESKRKFGVNTSVGGALETVWSYSANWIPNQVINEKLRIKAGGNAADTAAGAGAQSVVVNFLDENWLEVTETIVTAGALASTATTANCVRLISAKVLDVGTYHGSNTAGITLELTGGNIMGYVSADKGTTEQAILTIPSNKTGYITEILVSVGQGDSADVKMFSVVDGSDLATPFKGKREVWTLEDFSGAQVFKLDTHLKMESSEDVWFEAEKITGGGTARVSVDISYYTVLN